MQIFPIRGKFIYFCLLNIEMIKKTGFNYDSYDYKYKLKRLESSKIVIQKKNKTSPPGSSTPFHIIIIYCQVEQCMV